MERYRLFLGKSIHVMRVAEFEQTQRPIADTGDICRVGRRARFNRAAAVNLFLFENREDAPDGLDRQPVPVFQNA